MCGSTATCGLSRAITASAPSTLRCADIVGPENHLALQVGQRHGVVVDDADVAYAGRRQIQQHRRAEAAGAHHQHARGFQLRLAGTADLAQHDMARITFEFVAFEHRG